MRASKVIAGASGIATTAFLLWACSSTSPPATGPAQDGGADLAVPAETGADASDAADGASACPSDLPASCPSTIPSYQTDILPLLQRRCFMCHADGGAAGPTLDFSTYAKVYAQRRPMLDQVYACTMPPPDAAPPSLDERVTLLDWFVCGAPDN